MSAKTELTLWRISVWTLSILIVLMLALWD